MKKILITIFIFLFCFGCAEIKARHEAREYLKKITFKDESCESGYMILGITGHPPSCMSVEDVEELKREGLL